MLLNEERMIMKLCYGAVAIIYLAIGNNINDKVADVIHKYC